MSGSIFYIIGVGVTGLAVVAVVAVLAILFWANLIHRRFNLIFFRKGQRRLSIASWHSAALVGRDFDIDDWVIGERPFYLSYRVGKRRVFLMAGTIPDMPRFGKVRGMHPEIDCPTPPNRTDDGEDG